MALMWALYSLKGLNSPDHLLCAESFGESKKSNNIAILNLTVLWC